MALALGVCEHEQFTLRLPFVRSRHHNLRQGHCHIFDLGTRAHVSPSVRHSSFRSFPSPLTTAFATGTAIYLVLAPSSSGRTVRALRTSLALIPNALSVQHPRASNHQGFARGNGTFCLWGTKNRKRSLFHSESPAPLHNHSTTFPSISGNASRASPFPRAPPFPSAATSCFSIGELALFHPSISCIILYSLLQQRSRYCLTCFPVIATIVLAKRCVGQLTIHPPALPLCMVLWSARVKVTSILITPPDQSGKGEGEPGVVHCSRGVRIVQDISQSQLKRRMYISMIDVLELRSDGMYDPRSRTFHVLFHGDVMVNAMQ